MTIQNYLQRHDKAMIIAEYSMMSLNLITHIMVPEIDFASQVIRGSVHFATNMTMDVASLRQIYQGIKTKNIVDTISGISNMVSSGFFVTPKASSIISVDNKASFIDRDTRETDNRIFLKPSMVNAHSTIMGAPLGNSQLTFAQKLGAISVKAGVIGGITSSLLQIGIGANQIARGNRTQGQEDVALGFVGLGAGLPTLTHVQWGFHSSTPAEFQTYYQQNSTFNRRTNPFLDYDPNHPDVEYERIRQSSRQRREIPNIGQSPDTQDIPYYSARSSSSSEFFDSLEW